MRSLRLLSYLIGVMLLGGMMGQPVVAQTAPVARAVLFFSPSCPHCHVVLTETLPSLQARYGDQLHILTVDVTTPEGKALYAAAITAFAVPRDRLGVPALFCEQRHLVGSLEIPQQLPGLIEQALARGGNDWPAIPGLAAFIIDLDTTPAATVTTAPFNRDPLANSLALAVLVGIVISLVLVAPRLRWASPWAWSVQRNRLIPLVTSIGLLLAGYLAWIELRQQPAFCGPVGNCNLVHQSPYARLAGIPVAVLGVGGYVAILAVWLAAWRAQVAWAKPVLVGLVVIGTLFSLYLTFLEPFVIGATCLWCLGSAIVMTSLLWLVAPPVSRHVARGRRSLNPATRH